MVVVDITMVVVVVMGEVEEVEDVAMRVKIMGLQQKDNVAEEVLEEEDLKNLLNHTHENDNVKDHHSIVIMLHGGKGHHHHQLTMETTITAIIK